VLPVRYETIRTHKVEHMLGGLAPSRAEAVKEGMRLNGQPGQDRSQCDVVGIDHFNRVYLNSHRALKSASACSRFAA